MIPGPYARLKLEGDPLRLAAFLAAVGGLLSAFLAYFDGLVLALSALGAAVWLGRRTAALRPRAAPVATRPDVLWGSWPLLALGVGALGFFLLAHPPWSHLRGVVLGLSALPLGWGRSGPSPARSE